MRPFSKEEYLDLVTRVADEQYDTSDEVQLSDDWLFGPSDHIKKKVEKILGEGTVDLTNTRKDQIKELLFKSNDIKIYDFTIHIAVFHGEPDINGADLTVDITLYQEMNRTPSGFPCKMTTPLYLNKDGRFKGRPWLSYFHGPHGRNVPINTLVDIVRWMQVVKKLPAFL